MEPFPNPDPWEDLVEPPIWYPILVLGNSKEPLRVPGVCEVWIGVQMIRIWLVLTYEALQAPLWGPLGVKESETTRVRDLMRFLG